MWTSWSDYLGMACGASLMFHPTKNMPKQLKVLCVPNTRLTLQAKRSDMRGMRPQLRLKSGEPTFRAPNVSCRWHWLSCDRRRPWRPTVQMEFVGASLRRFARMENFADLADKVSLWLTLRRLFMLLLPTLTMTRAPDRGSTTRFANSFKSLACLWVCVRRSEFRKMHAFAQ